MSFNSLLNQVILEATPISKAIDQAHTNPLGIWWYDRVSKKVSYSKYQGQRHDPNVKGEGVTQVRGRLFNDYASGKNIVVVWTNWNASAPILRLTRDEIELIVKEVQRQSNEIVSGVVDEYGDDISESKQGSK